jgi:ferric-dicitrate binding protein FerR (iron transport regulator)
MKQEPGKSKDTNRDDETMERLLRLAGPRKPIPSDLEARVYGRVHQEWLASSRPPEADRVYRNVHRAWSRKGRNARIRQWGFPLAMAASIVVAVVLIRQPDPSRAVPGAIGTVARVVGAQAAGQLPESGQEVYPGMAFTTGPEQGISLLLTDNISFRIGENSTIEAVGAHEFRVLQGRVYADTGDLMYRRSNLLVLTPVAAVRDIGTQFAVIVDGNDLEIAVREGRVDVRQDGTVSVAVAGERMQLDAGGIGTVEALLPHDAYWRWTSSLAPAFDIEGKSLLEFLRWAARETGKRLEFEDQDLRMAAMRVDLHGTVADIPPIEALQSVMATTTFRFQVDADRILIKR